MGIFTEEVGQTFSDIWYRVGPTRPRLSPHAQIVRQEYGPTVAFIVEDPAGGQYYRLTESAYFFVALLDGRRTVDEAWNACNTQLGDAAPTQRECIELLSRLQLFGLLLGDLPLAADMVLERKTQSRQMRIRKRTGFWMFYTIPIWNPERFLERYAYLFRAVFSRWGGAAWLAVVATALVLVFQRAGDLASGLNHLSELDPTDVLSIALLFGLLRTLHELGHATACKAMGGRCTEIGVILVAGLLPLPYCDASSAWRMPETWKRVLISAAGMIVETFVAAVAAIIWATANNAPRVQALCFTAMVVSGVTTLIFNGNPLLRYDGYYILSDVTGTPNLAQRSRELWVFLFERYVFGMRSARPPRVRDAAEGRLLAVYGALSVPYRFFVGALIITVLAKRFLTVGIVLAVVMGVMWLAWPLLKGLSYIAGSPRLVGRRARAAAVVAGSVAVLGVGLGLVPAPAAGYASGTLEPVRLGSLRAGEDGFIASVLKAEGDEVEAGEPVFVLENPEIQSAEREVAAQLDGALARLDAAIAQSPREVELARAEVVTLEGRLARVRDQIRRLVVAAPVSGRIATTSATPGSLRNLEGRYVPRGGLLGVVLSERELVVRAVVTDNEHAYIFGGETLPRASVRVRGNAGVEIEGTVSRIAPAGTRDLTSQALSTSAGGDIPTVSGSSGRGAKALSPGFLVEITPGSEIPGAQPGQRAGVRFGVAPEPLLRQWLRKGEQYFSAKLRQ